MKAGQKGISLIVALLFMLVVTTMVVMLVSKVAMEGRIGLHQLYNKEAFYAAEGFLERGLPVLVEDAAGDQSDPTQPGYTATVYLDPYSVAYHVEPTTNWYGACFYTLNPTLGTDYVRIKRYTGWYKFSNFSQRVNLCGARIKDVSVVYRIKTTNDSGAGVLVEFEISGSSITHTDITKQVKNPSWPSGVESIDVSSVLTTWKQISDVGIRVKHIDSDNYGYLNIDYVALQVKIGIDASTEPWATGDFVSYPLNLDRVQTIDKIRISDEAGKININYAPLHLISSLFTKCGFSSDAAAAAADVVTYRNAHFFKTIDEIVTASPSRITAARFENIQDYITVHSWVNNWLQLPIANRVPININTASQTVLESMFSPYLGDSKASTLATEIISRRETQPFTSMFSSFTYGSAGGDANGFATFVDSLSGTFSAEDKSKIKEIADGSPVNATRTATWNSSVQSTYEICYYSNAYQLDARAQRKISGTITPAHVHLREIAGFLYNYTNQIPDPANTLCLSMPTYFLEANPKPYWRQIF